MSAAKGSTPGTSRRRSSISGTTSRCSPASRIRCSTTASRSPSCRASTSSTTSTRDASPPTGSSRTLATVLEVGQFSLGVFSEPLAFSAALKRHCSRASASSTSCTTTSASATASPSSRRRCPLIVTLHHPITRDRMLEMARHRAPSSAGSIGRWYNFVKMQGKVASRMPRIVVVSENSIKDIHTDMGVSLDRMRLVPVGVDPELFKPVPGVARVPGRLITTASADVALKGLAYLLEAIAKLRTERDVTLTMIGKPREASQQRSHRQLGLRPYIEFVSAVCPTSGSSSCTAKRRWRSCRACTRGSACRRSRRCAPELRSSPPTVEHSRRSRASTARPCCSARPATSTIWRRRSGGRSTIREVRARHRGRRSSPRRRSVELAALRRAHRRSVPRGAGDAAERRQAATQRAALMLTIRFDQLGVQPGDVVLDVGSGSVATCSTALGTAPTWSRSTTPPTR